MIQSNDMNISPIQIPTTIYDLSYKQFVDISKYMETDKTFENKIFLLSSLSGVPVDEIKTQKMDFIMIEASLISLQNSIELFEPYKIQEIRIGNKNIKTEILKINYWEYLLIQDAIQNQKIYDLYQTVVAVICYERFYGELYNPENVQEIEYLESLCLTLPAVEVLSMGKFMLGEYWSCGKEKISLFRQFKTWLHKIMMILRFTKKG